MPSRKSYSSWFNSWSRHRFHRAGFRAESTVSYSETFAHGSSHSTSVRITVINGKVTVEVDDSAAGSDDRHAGT